MTQPMMVTFLFVAYCQPIFANPPIDAVLTELGDKIRPSVVTITAKKKELNEKYQSACLREEKIAKASENNLGLLFWQLERERSESGDPPLSVDQKIPNRSSVIRKAWFQQRKNIENTQQKLLATHRQKAILDLQALENEFAQSDKNAQRIATWTRNTLENSSKYLEALTKGSSDDYGLIVDGNVAHARNGTKVKAQNGAMQMVDGITGTSTNRAKMPLNKFIVLTFPTTFRLDRIRLDLMKLDNPRDSGRKYRFLVESSTDSKNWQTLIDRTQKPNGWVGWQDFTFSARPIKAIRIKGTYNNRGSALLVTELEAFCPKRNR